MNGPDAKRTFALRTRDEEACLFAARWIMVPLTRAVDTVVITLRHADSPLAKALKRVASLACGRIATTTDRNGLHQHFEEMGWELWDEKWLRDRLQRISECGYENQVSAVIAKLLLRGKWTVQILCALLTGPVRLSQLRRLRSTSSGSSI
jgi:hypothetical protein